MMPDTETLWIVATWAMLVVGLAWWPCGGCVTCVDVSDDFEDGTIASTWTTSGTVTETGGRLVMSAGSSAEWNQDITVNQAIGVVFVFTSGNAVDMRIHIAYGNGDGYYGKVSRAAVAGTAVLLELFNNAGTKINTVEFPAATLTPTSVSLRWTGSTLTFKGGASATCALTVETGSVPTGKRFKIEAVEAVSLSSVVVDTVNDARTGDGCVATQYRCPSLGDIEGPANVTATFAGVVGGVGCSTAQCVSLWDTPLVIDPASPSVAGFVNSGCCYYFTATAASDGFCFITMQVSVWFYASGGNIWAAVEAAAGSGELARWTADTGLAVGDPLSLTAFDMGAVTHIDGFGETCELSGATCALDV